MIGAFIGDIVGSTYEFKRQKGCNVDLFPTGSGFTDDSIMTVAIGDALMEWKNKGGELKTSFADTMKKYGKTYPHPYGGYGSKFAKWLVRKQSWPYWRSTVQSMFPEVQSRWITQV